MGDLVLLDPTVYYMLQDMIVSRPVEFTVLYSLVKQALNRYSDERETLTNHQERALELADIAAAAGENSARYVSVRMGIGERAAYNLLARARDRAKMFNSGSNRVSIGITQSQRSAMRRLEAGYVQTCPGRPANSDCDGSIKGGRDLCQHCYHKYGFEGERPDWLVFLIDEARRERREWARDQVMLAEYDDETAGV